jgi:hypothetical protein
MMVAVAIAMRWTPRRGHHATQNNPTNHRRENKPKRRIDSHVVLPSFSMAAPFGLSARSDEGSMM